MVMSQPDASRAAAARPDALSTIRSATAHCHARLEREVDWPMVFSSPSDYLVLLRRFLRVVEPLESRIERFAPIWELAGRRERSCRLKCDIEAVQRAFAVEVQQEHAESNSINVEFVVDQATALGALYVLEGSALGGQILARQVQDSAARWPRSNGQGVEQLHEMSTIDSYFTGRGADTGLAWRTFCQRLNDELTDVQTASIAARAAVQTFEAFYLCLVGKRACVRP